METHHSRQVAVFRSRSRGKRRGARRAEERARLIREGSRRTGLTLHLRRRRLVPARRTVLAGHTSVGRRKLSRAAGRAGGGGGCRGEKARRARTTRRGGGRGKGTRLAGIAARHASEGEGARVAGAAVYSPGCVVRRESRGAGQAVVVLGARRILPQDASLAFLKT